MNKVYEGAWYTLKIIDTINITYEHSVAQILTPDGATEFIRIVAEVPKERLRNIPVYHCLSLKNSTLSPVGHDYEEDFLYFLTHLKKHRSSC